MAYGTLKADKITYDAGGSDSTPVNVSDLVAKASITSPEFDGIPKAPTAAADTNTTQIATTAYVQTELGGSQSIDGSYTQAAKTITQSATPTVDLSTGNYFTLTQNANITSWTFSHSLAAGETFSFVIELTNASYSTAWTLSSGAVKWPADVPPTLAASKTHLIIFTTDNQGTIWRASSLADYTTS